MTGYLKLQRSLFSHWLWDEKRSFSKAEAWLDLLQLAAFAPSKRVIQGKLIGLSVGELVASVRYLAERWGWGKDKAAKFLQMLESDSMIRRESRQGETVLSVCKYADYNQSADSEPDSKKDSEPTPARQRADKGEEGKEDRRRGNTPQSPPAGGGGEPEPDAYRSKFVEPEGGAAPLAPFDQFWAGLPPGCKVGKDAARKAWAKAVKRARGSEPILAGLPGYRAYEAKRSQQADYRPLHPSTWLNGGRWEDEHEPEKPDDTNRPLL